MAANSHVRLAGQQIVDESPLGSGAQLGGSENSDSTTREGTPETKGVSLDPLVVEEQGQPKKRRSLRSIVG